MKLVAIDVDGTLLNSNGEISSENITAMKKVVANHHIVSIATGRTCFDVRHLLKGRISIPIISTNGAAIYDESDRLLSAAPIDFDTVREIIECLLEAHMYIEIATTNQILATRNGRNLFDLELKRLKEDVPSCDERKLWKMSQSQFSQFGWAPVDDFHKVLTADLPVYKISTFSFNKEKLKQFRVHFADHPKVDYTASSSNMIEFIHKNTNKGTGVLQLAEKYQIKPEDIVTIGDSYNDFSMFHRAGTKIAMGNAVSELKEISSLITETNDNNGVAYALNYQLNLVE
ncbi:Cof-type HAD-IIB family hydrolase [Sporolactobacillus kofuensis]|uniref:Cof-type HAD-IIB family hydrolase n=1 Tax=Sporolactobacillus kofuensis TaxID=269672 RepID=A0ABW1WGY1_9BACL|nr:Cof-type HAD-IIB family hydrolase [Sporolactobacillus kofuensis]MCO7176193.1 Cof-type HAD-IIB family hydrolase [Sporolactobacillus kofuensis]